ncbi:MAG TPA: 4Fe-4S dicluster domain-containing protein [Accumulibacter sp.]|uniref:4Fe-4S dicluster domain-containing protein n=4 Tax=Accumulibacter sp. TaxID=2053492 RepID=UPI00287AADD4|nr:4Fe-4S dicluster domain-containing protein [Accumulibacter sp.]MDS4056228.1 4Fe-4S dicluster domain-containing protein [Accumulibacter sp.]HMV05738.1 4Fe-4S dicluster domain-containing protein [Accumulibacter sp.]HMW81666.1 4Fe-4S dicluster domain-containing protein [Accumulibacter sp.]HNB68932.1 4Fe-4S dicluster domain-containing protein [Accumulibacter sp.]HNE40783.1 4Fe-4S dicluster domain-containing protein [Accumulibacter sp.]
MNNKLDMAEVKVALERKVAQTYEPVRPAVQLGFVHNNVDCIGCRACEIACKDKNGLPPGPRFRRVMYIEGGTYPDVYAYKVNMSCNHCAEPACLPTCPTGAIWKRADNGVVDIDSTLCIGCRRCEAACPFGAPQWDPIEKIVKKCNLCIDELEANRKPYCVMACMMRVLDIGPIDKLWQGAHPTPAIGPHDKPVRQVKNMANPELTTPSIAFIPHSKGRVE